MTNNPTIDGVSRELLERLTRPIRKATDEPDRINARKELRALLDADHTEKPLAMVAPAVERQEPIKLQHVAVAEGGNLRWMTGRKLQNCELYAMPDGAAMRSPLYVETPEVSTLQSTIAQLQARITQLESEAEFAVATYQAARDRITELESGIGEPAGFGTFRNGKYGSWLFESETSAKCHLKTANDGRQMNSEIHALYTAPPALVAVVLPERQSARESFECGGVAQEQFSKGWNACRDATAALNGVRK